MIPHRLSDKVAVVTGAGSGIGAGAAKRLAAEGASVVLGDIALANAQKVVAEIVADGGIASAIAFDAADASSIEALIGSAVAEYGGLDILHSNAAPVDDIVAEGGCGVVDVPIDLWDRMMAVNLRGYMLGAKYAIPRMLERGGGSIVHTSSVVSLAPLPVQPAYASSKGGINTLTMSIAATYGKQGIRCNAICPGFIVTEATEPTYAKEFKDAVIAHMAGARLGRPEDIAAAVAYFASDDSSYVNGQILSVDGGLTVPSPLLDMFAS